MQAEYRREMNHSYLVLKADEEMNPQEYEIKMLLHNAPVGLLPLSVRYIDGEPLFYYEVTSKQSISLLYETKKFGKEDLERIFRAAADVMEKLEEYLLDVETLLFNPRYIYMDTERQNIYFCCFPVRQEKEQAGILELTEYILPKIDHKDAGAVVLGYGVYRESVESGMGADEIRKELRKVPLETLKEEEARQKEEYTQQEYAGEAVMTEEKRKQALDAFFEEEEEVEEKHPLLNAVGCIFTLAAAAVCIYLLLHYEIANTFQICIGLSAAAAAGTGAFVVFRLKKAREEKKRKKRDLDQLEAWGWERDAEYEREDISEAERHANDSPKEEKKEADVLDTCGPTILLSPDQEDEADACLFWMEEGVKKRFMLTKDMGMIGKLTGSADICLRHPAVSRIHGRIRKEGKDFFISDLNSKNGTLLNDRMLDPEREYLLHNGDKISIAGTELEYRNFQNIGI